MPTEPITEEELSHGDGYWIPTDLHDDAPKPNATSDTWMWVKDALNSWRWRGDACRPRYLSKADVAECLADTSIVIYGDSLTNELYTNIAELVPDLALPSKGRLTMVTTSTAVTTEYLKCYTFVIKQIRTAFVRTHTLAKHQPAHKTAKNQPPKVNRVPTARLALPMTPLRRGFHETRRMMWALI
jgi:hypothetical protein